MQVVGVSGMTVRRVERGYIPFLSTRVKFARALGVAHDELFDAPDLPAHYRDREDLAAAA